MLPARDLRFPNAKWTFSPLAWQLTAFIYMLRILSHLGAIYVIAYLLRRIPRDDPKIKDYNERTCNYTS